MELKGHSRKQEVVRVFYLCISEGLGPEKITPNYTVGIQDRGDIKAYDSNAALTRDAWLLSLLHMVDFTTLF